MPPLAHPSGSPLVLHAGKADTGSCRAQSGVSAAKAAGAWGKQAAARDALSSGKGAGFISRQGCMEALWRKGSSPGPGTLSHRAARAGGSSIPSTAVGACFSPLPAQAGWDAGLVVAPSRAGDCGSSSGLPPWPHLRGAAVSPWAWCLGGWLMAKPNREPLRGCCFGLPFGAGSL